MNMNETSSDAPENAAEKLVYVAPKLIVKSTDETKTGAPAPTANDAGFGNYS